MASQTPSAPSRSRSSANQKGVSLHTKDTLIKEIEAGPGVKNVTEGRKHLERIGWLEANTTPTSAQLATMLLSAAKRINEIEITNVIRAVAFIVDKRPLEELTFDIVEKIKADVTEITNSMIKTVSDCTQQNIQLVAQHCKEIPNSSQSIEKKLDNVHGEIKNLIDVQRTHSQIPTISYSDAVKANQPAATANPASLRIFNKLQIQARQVLIDFNPGGDSVPDRSPETAKAYQQKIEEIMAKLPNTPDCGLDIQNLTITPQAQVLVEFSNPKSAKWIREKNNMDQFLESFDSHAIFKPRTYPVVLKFIPIPFEIELPENLRELEKQNGCKPGDLVAAKWIKSPPRRRLNQKHAHAKLFCASPEVANLLITSTVRVNNKATPQTVQNVPSICVGFKQYKRRLPKTYAPFTPPKQTGCAKTVIYSLPPNCLLDP
ncbi:hypothetical protein CPB86DRAFT_803125 [Serendipita vermifera]|nr:hypothetical protein CPB86DRAFT_803125 [Serendipita vermifera]